MAELSRRTCLAALVFGIASPARSHHGFGGLYDVSKPVFLKGEVLRASFRRPHPVINLGVARNLELPTVLTKGAEFLGRVTIRPEDQGRAIEIEYPPVRLFFKLRGQIKIGDRIATIAYRNCRPPHQLRGQWVRLADGSEVVREGRMQTEVERCEA